MYPVGTHAVAGRVGSLNRQILEAYARCSGHLNGHQALLIGCALWVQIGAQNRRSASLRSFAPAVSRVKSTFNCQQTSNVHDRIIDRISADRHFDDGIVARSHADGGDQVCRTSLGTRSRPSRRSIDHVASGTGWRTDVHRHTIAVDATGSRGRLVPICRCSTWRDGNGARCGSCAPKIGGGSGR